MTAVNPQITKSYAENKIVYMNLLIGLNKSERLFLNCKIKPIIYKLKMLLC